MGPIGADGPKGVGPPVPVAFQRLGNWPEGGSWTSDQKCKGLGIKDNLGGLCEALCDREECLDREVGFKLKNTKGLRFDGYSFDDNHIEKGNNQPRNICALAKYGNKGAAVDKVALSTSYGVTDAGVVQPHWYGNCNNGDENSAKCCSNSVLFQGKVLEWSFAHGNQCTGDSDTDGVMTELYCIYDQTKFDEFSKPKQPADVLKKGGVLVSDATEQWKKALQSPNRKFEFKVNPDNGLPQVWNIKDQDHPIKIWDGELQSQAGPKPFTIKFVGEGTVAELNANGDVIWQRGMKADNLELDNKGNLNIFAVDGDNKKLVWDKDKNFEKDKPAPPASRRRL